MSSFFEVRDPRGKQVNCTKENWEHHIIDHHPELVGREKDVARSIEEPLAIYQDVKDVDSNVYYRPSSLPPPDNRGYIRTVVQYRKAPIGKERGFVIAAYIVPKVKDGETLIWPKD